MEYIVEKQVDNEWYYEGRGNLTYVNNVIAEFTRFGTVVRVRVSK